MKLFSKLFDALELARKRDWFNELNLCNQL